MFTPVLLCLNLDNIDKERKMKLS
ncbi:TPA: DUF1161 domain-containing protein, partial [Klebsiella pneumoniae]|nr:DUF1161 domain-containing protein [Klebsiella pneumoniae]